MSLLERAIALAAKAHEGQLDKAGAPYILHALRVMLKMETNEEMTAAVLHDVVEDTDVTLDDLRHEGFGEVVLEAVDLMTHRASDSYDAYVEKLKDHTMARKIKRADLMDNMDLRRMISLTDEEMNKILKYYKAWEKLRNGKGRF